MLIRKEPQFSNTIQAGLLQDRCNQILEYFFRAGVSASIDDDVNGALKDEYNRLSYELDTLQCDPEMDPLAILPPEIWTDVLRKAITEDSSNLSSTDVLLSFSLVNRHWRAKIFETPTLWTTITIGSGEADAQAKLVTALYFSKYLPIRIEVIDKLFGWEEIAPRLRGHAHRIQEIRFLRGYTNFDVYPYASPTDQIISSIGPLLSLTTVHHKSYGMTPNWRRLLAKSPGLRHLYGHGTSLTLDLLRNTSAGAQLRSCRVFAIPSDFILHLDELVHLERLVWTVDVSPDANMHTRSSLSTSFPALKRIENYGPSDANFFAVLKLSGHLTSLVFTLQKKWRHLYDLFILLPHLPCLLDFELHLRQMDGDCRWPAIGPIRTRVQNLQITSYRQGSTHDARFTQSLFHVFPSYFPDVTHLSLECSPLSPSVVGYINSATRLLSLRLSGVNIMAEHDISINAPSLKFLWVVGCVRVVNDLIARLGRSLVSNFTLYVTDTEGTCNWEGSIASHITQLRTNLLRLVSELPTFDVLRKLDLLHSPPSATGLIINLILRPGSFPKLEEIQMAFSPELDLLFIMLEGRNLLPASQGITRIDTLILPSPLPPFILAPITELLRGRFTKRPPNYDLSFYGLMDAYFDPLMPGCRRCFLSMMHCSRVIDRGVLGGDPFQVHSINLPLAQPSVPTEVWDWLQQRDGRVAEWDIHRKAWDKKGIGRRSVCLEMRMAQHPFIVTAHSSAGFT